MSKPSGGAAVMAQRHAALDSLDLFPTPPWATRALVEEVLPRGALDGALVREPAGGLGHITDVLADYAVAVIESDVFDYGRGSTIGSYVGHGLDVLPPERVHWVITNPPFNLALEFAERGLREAERGLALLVRSAWAEGHERYFRLFADTPPTTIAQFCDRVPMVKERWDPEATSATAYAWFVWSLEEGRAATGARFMWIRPNARLRYSRADDVRRFASRRAPAPC